MATLESKSIFFEWPFGPWVGQPVRRYHSIGKYNITVWGTPGLPTTEYRVTEIGKANPYGGADRGVIFKDLQSALEYIHDLVH